MSVGGETAAITPRFTSVSIASSQSHGVNAERSAEISTKRERVVEQAQSHFEKHHQVWTNRQYGRLLARDGERMTLQPAGMPDDRKAHLMRAADSIVLQRQAKRLARIERAAGNMLDRPQNEKAKGFGRG